MQFVEVLAPAKINLSLRVLRRRDDGFHEIETFIAPITLCDSLEITSCEQFEFRCSDPTLPANEHNLVVRAARAFFAATSIAPNVLLVLSKRIPHGAGLGGGSSDAAATLRGLDRFFATQLAPERLAGLAAELGSDVPFFMQATAAICRGRGEIVTPAAISARLSLLLLKPEFGVATSWAYSRWCNAPELPGINYEAQQLGNHAFVNDLERPVFEKFVFLAYAKAWLSRQPEVAAALLSGSGSTLFAVLRDAASAQDVINRARAELDRDLWAQACETI